MEAGKILLVGPYPPPYGGISIQVKNLETALKKKGYLCKVLDVFEHQRVINTRRIPLYAYLKFARNLIVFSLQRYSIHCFTNGHNIKSWISAFACSLAGLGNNRRVVLTLGSGDMPGYVSKTKCFMKFIIKMTLLFVRIIIVRNENSLKTLSSLGVKREKIKIMSGFFGIPSYKKRTIPESIRHFLGMHYPFIGANLNIAPEYGTTLLLEAFSEIIKKYPNAGLFIAGISEEQAQKMLPVIETDKNIYFSGFLPHELSINIMGHYNLFVRPTYFDGDSISVREALALNIPVIASKTDYRPSKTILFRIGDKEDLLQKMTYTIQNLEKIKKGLKKSAFAAESNTIEKLTKLYETLK